MIDKLIDQLMAERKHAQSLGMAQNEKDASLLLALLLEDAKRNPERYTKRLY